MTAATETDPRRAAQAVFSAEPSLAEWVEYRSEGRVLILGAADEAWAAAIALPPPLRAAVLATAPAAQPPEAPPPVPTVYGQVQALQGHLGAYTLEAEARGRGRLAGAALFGPDWPAFDLVLDLNAAPALRVELKPPGYHHAPDPATRAPLIAGLADWVGSFQKPRYFRYEAEICAHGARGLKGCQNCLDACAAGAILSLGERIEVDPYRCQGCGSCSTRCPSGAIRYAWPAPGELIDQLRGALRAWREAGGAPGPSLLFLGSEAAETPAVQAALAAAPGHLLALTVEDVGALGLEVWLSALAFGAGRLRLLTAEPGHARAIAATAAELAGAAPLLAALGDPLAATRIGRLRLPDLAALDPCPPWPGAPATYAGLGSKRELLQQALSHLAAAAGVHTAAPVPLPAGAALGEIRVDREACTLCMACVSVCPASAVQGGGALPQLKFREDRCLQCGLCAQACPEDAIRLAPRFDLASHLAPAERLLNEEALAHCGGCGKPFGTVKLLARMRSKLAGHWMYQSPEAQARLGLCEDCRVKALYTESRD
jgi:ferredoxin